MFRPNMDGTSDKFGGGFNMLGQSDMYFDANSMSGTNMSMPPPPPASVSSASLSPPTTPLTPEPITPFGSQTQFPLLTDTNHLSMNATMLGAALSASVQGGNMNDGSPLHSTMLLQRQYEYQCRLLLQQRQQQLMLAEQQLKLAASASAANHQGKDEIAHSLKMFALLTACSSEKGHGSRQEIMQDFAANGYVSDDFNRLQYSNPNATLVDSSPSQTPLSEHMTTAPLATHQLPPGLGNVFGNVPISSLPALHWLNLNNYKDHLNNMWRKVSYGSSHSPTNVGLMASVGNMGLVASGANINTSCAGSNANNPLGLGVNGPQDHIRTINGSNIKLQKRQNNTKTKDVNRHCVFCENNNEPEAVVNSHSVRDTLGRVLCPKLRTYVCPICRASGDSAHTIKYCPKKPIITMEDAIKANSFRLAKSAYYKQQMKV
ncbi:protein nanos [Scaptodrosophila lebanonensis]|uniref:Protein nanos n=1 Tax=Drosophila lebanonensis TaxID=7225 RepID=A0A6J2T2E8_DROLE|nr:protein nanos [Scaptodrosophila lebanonensis]